MKTNLGISRELASELQRTLTEVGVDAFRTTGERVSTQSRCLFLTSEHDGRQFVLKVLNSDYRHNSLEALEREFVALKRFFGVTRECRDIGAAEPLHLFRNPPAYLMTHVEGVGVGTFLQRHRLSADKIAILADRVVNGVRIFHASAAGLYGDFQSENVLVDRWLRISFIDPTIPNPAFVELERRVDWSPMSADLGYWVYSTSSRGFRQSLHSPLGVLSMLRLTTSMVDTAAREHGEANRDDFVNAVYQAAGFHVRRLKEQARLRPKVLAILTRGLLTVLRAKSR